MKILVVCESLYVNSSSASKGRLALIESFVRNEYQVTVLHYSYKEILIEGVTSILVKEKKGGLYLLSRMQRLLSRYLKIDISKYVDILLGFSFGFFNDANSLSKALKKYNSESFDSVWTLSKGDSYRSHRAVLKNSAWHNKWFAYVHDPYPQQLYPRPYNFIPYGYKKKRLFFNQITKQAKCVVFPSLLLKEWMQSYYVALKVKSLIIPHQIIELDYSKVKLPSYFNPNNFNILHAGSLLDLRDPLVLVEAYSNFLKLLPEAKKDTALLFIGNRSIFSNDLEASKNTLPNLYTSDGYVDFDIVYAMQQKAAINIILEAKSEISPFLPGKFPHCIAANKPIFLVGPYYSECKRLLGDSYPYSFDFDDTERMTKSLIELYKTWKADANKLELNRNDLASYLSSAYINNVLTEKTDKYLV